jgi:hypothetical protein
VSAKMTLEKRVAKLEAEVKALKKRIHTQNDWQSWLDRVSGSLKDDPEWPEIVRRGRQFAEEGMCFGKAEPAK